MLSKQQVDIETPEAKGSDVGGWIIQGGCQSICTQLTSPKGIANLMRLHNPATPQTESDSVSAGSTSNSNRFAALQEEEEEDSNATTDVVPIDGIAEAIQDVSGPVVRPADETHARCITNGYLRIRHDRGRCNGIGMISRGSLNKSSLFRYFIPHVV